MRCPYCSGRVVKEIICPSCKNELEEWRKANAKVTRPITVTKLQAQISYQT